MVEHRFPKPAVRGSSPFRPATYLKLESKMNKLSEGVGSLKTFLEEVKVELLKCTWPTRKELFGQSLVVVISVIILGAFVGLCDVVNMNLLRFIIR